jgi:hypothetical protein
MKKIKLAGIYKLTHIPTEHYYIGMSVDIFSRWGSHYSDSKKNIHSSNLDLSDPTQWKFEVLEYCSITEFKKDNPTLKGNKLTSLFRGLLLRREKHHMSNHSVTYALNKNNKYFQN